MKLDWSNSEDIAELLFEKYPETDPLTVRFTDLHKMVCGLPNFEGDPKKSSEGILEAIQMAWLEAFQDR